MARFKRGVGYLALQAGVDILPMYLKGAHDALPVGRALPRGRDMSAHVGPCLSHRRLVALTEGLSRHQAYDVATAVVEDAVLSLRDGRAPDDAAASAKTLGRAPEAETAPAPAQGPATGSLSRLFGDLERGFRPGKLDAPISYYFSLGAEDSGKWTLVVGPDSCQFTPGKPEGGTADCVLKTDEATFTRIVKESYVPSFAEFMSGKVKTNSPDLLRTFQKAFGL
jgi:long-chain acyl-CoA synthetase